MMRAKTEKGSNSSKGEQSIWARAVTANSEWPDKEEFLDVIYWGRQVVGIIIGVAWGLVPLKGFPALFLFVLVNAGSSYLYLSGYQQVDEDEFGGAWELTKEGFVTSFAGFLQRLWIRRNGWIIGKLGQVTWIIIYSGLHFE